MARVGQSSCASCVTRAGSRADAQLRYTADGVAFVTFAVAVDDANRPDGAAAEWVRAAVYGEQAEDLEPRLTKGTPVYLEGRVRLDLWTPAGGEQRASLKLTAWVCQPMGQIGRRAARPEGRRRRRATAGRDGDGSE